VEAAFSLRQDKITTSERRACRRRRAVELEPPAPPKASQLAGLTILCTQIAALEQMLSGHLP